MLKVEPAQRVWGGGTISAPVCTGGRGIAGRLLDQRLTFFSMVLICLVLTASLLAPVLSPYGRDEIDLDDILAAPSTDHILGTDELGRDVLARLMYGGRFTLLLALLSAVVASCIGIILGATAGYFGGAADAAVTGAVDLFLSVPVFLVLLIAASAAGGRLWIIPFVIGGTSWMETARLVRVEVSVLRGEEFVQAARSMGVQDAVVITRHILPNVVAPVIVSATIGFAQAMLIESALSFLGFGVQPPLPTWGNMLHNAQVLLRRAPAAAFAPGFMIFIACLCFNCVGDGLRRALARSGRSM